MQRGSSSSFDVVDAAGRRVRIEVATSTVTVAELAAAMGLPGRLGLVIGGVTVGPQRRLVDIDALVEGASVVAVAPDGRAAPPASPGGTGHLEFAVVTGPCCRPWAPLAVGRHGLGRAPTSLIRLDDPAVELHHSLIDVGRSVRLVQLTGRAPIEVCGSDGAPVEADGDGWFDLQPGGSVSIGRHRVEFRSVPGDARSDVRAKSAVAIGVAELGPAPGDPWHMALRRGPVATDIAPDPPIECVVADDLPPPPSPTALVGAVGAVVLAGVLGQAMFALMALAGAAASAATWLAGVTGWWRRRRRSRRNGEARRAAFIADLRDRHRSIERRRRREHPDAIEALAELLGDRGRVWSRRPGDGPWSATLGRGVVLWPPDVADRTDARPSAAELAAIDQWSRFVDAAIPMSIAPSDVVAMVGADDQVVPLVRSLVVQLATWIGPADLHIVVVSDRPDRWGWTSWLPHTARVTASTSVVDATRADQLELLLQSQRSPRRTLLVVDACDALALRTGPLRQLVAWPGVATVVVCSAGSGVPTVCRRVLAVHESGHAEWSGPGAVDGPVVEHLAVAGFDEATATAAAHALAGLIDPEDPTRASENVPSALAYSTLDPEPFAGGADTADVIAERWRTSTSATSLAVRLGASSDGPVEVDLVRDGPHALVAGTTGSGKSELLRTWVAALACRFGPAELQLLFIDYKGGATFDECARLPHTVGVVTDLDAGMADRALVGLDAELTRRETLLRQAGAADVRDRLRTSGGPLPRLVVMIDEFATMAQDVPGFLSALVAIAQRGRSLGVHLVLATQRPAGVVTDDIRANTNLRLALRVSDRIDALDVIADDLPATFPRAVPGRCAVRFGHDDLLVFQTASVRGARPSRRPAIVARPWPPPTGSANDAGASGDDELTHLLRGVTDAAAATGVATGRPIWLAPLPDVLEHAEVDAVMRAAGGPDVHDAIGVIDDPARQARTPLRWEPTAGNLLLVGAVGSGVTSTMVALACATARTRGPDRLHLYVIDGCGDRSLDALGQIAHCGAVVRIGEPERIDRLVARLGGELDRRASGRHDGDVPAIVLFVDGIGELRRSLDSVDRLPTRATLERVLDAGPAVGIRVCCSTDGSTLGSTVTAAERWLFRVDGEVASRFGGRAVPSDRPAGRIRVATTGLDGQVALGADGLAALPGRSSGSGPGDVVVLPTWVDPRHLPFGTRTSSAGRTTRELVLGTAADDLQPAALLVPAGDHVFIGGVGRTGRTTVLARVAAAWRDLEGDDSVVEWPWDPDVAGAPAGGAQLVVVDDADRVDDVGGVLAAALRGGDVTIAIAARLDWVRSNYGHWTREVTRSRCGVVMTAAGDVDGDLLGATLPRRPSIPARPGLGWIVDGRGHRLAQFAGRLPP